MTVKELIEILNTHDPKLTVVVSTIVNNVDIDHLKPGIGYSAHVPGVVIYPKN